MGKNKAFSRKLEMEFFESETETETELSVYEESDYSSNIFEEDLADNSKVDALEELRGYFDEEILDGMHFVGPHDYDEDLEYRCLSCDNKLTNGFYYCNKCAREHGLSENNKMKRPREWPDWARVIYNDSMRYRRHLRNIYRYYQKNVL